MSLISIHGIRVSFGGPPLLDGIALDIQKGQRVCILGRNGVGKSTLMKIIARELVPDAGEFATASGMRAAYLPQEVPGELGGTVFEIVAAGAGEAGEKLVELHRLEAAHADAARMHDLHHYLDEHKGWHVQTLVKRILSLTQLDGAAEYSILSGGMRRRVLLARALAREPDLLLLDEPTNHLDIPSIAWLENFILSSKLAVVFVTHDRRLLKRLATRIIELDRGQLFDWSCDYETFLRRKQAALDAEEKDWARFDKKLAQEEVWIRKGIKARRCRDEGRVKALQRMREERKKRRSRLGAVKMAISEAQRSGDLVVEAEGVSFSYGGTPVISKLDLDVTRGDRVGVVGPNGCGKTTLLNLLLGKIRPQAGEIEIGTNVAVAYFDQLREALDPGRSVWENIVSDGKDTVEVNGSPRHVFSYLQDFLFTSERARCPVSQLSGGERNRLLLARLFTRPANLLVFDEPTNDLDTETLELLEERLVDFSGTALIVSHDREFLNSVVTSTLAYEGDGVFKEYVGGYDDLERQRRETAPPEPDAPAPRKSAKEDRPQPVDAGPRKLSYKERQELETLPALIEDKEREHEQLNLQMADPTFYAKPGFVAEARRRVAEIEREVAEAYRRWEELDGRSST